MDGPDDVALDQRRKSRKTKMEIILQRFHRGERAGRRQTDGEESILDLSAYSKTAHSETVDSYSSDLFKKVLVNIP